MLPNLHDAAIAAQQRYRNEFTANEIELSGLFKDTYGASLRRDRQDVDFTAHTAIVTTSGNLKMYIPNQWFCAAAYTTQFIQVFIQYKQLLDTLLSTDYPTATDKKGYIKTLKETEDPAVIENFRQRLIALLPGQIHENEVADTASLLTNFSTNYEWWFGNKTIDRGDSYVSPVLSLLGVVNASQSYIADISYKYATEPDLANAALEMIAAPADRNAANEPVVADIEITQPRLTGGINEIVYGAPGTGKSRYLEDTYGHTTISTRVVFHPEYTVFDFIGAYKPVPLYRPVDVPLHMLSGEQVTTGEPVIDYRFVPGPFIRCLVEASLDPTHMYTLIIEEINRANAAAVFADIFQLLDRDMNGMSEYSVMPAYDLSQYLLSIDGMRGFLEDGLRIPSNMNIVATMNSADQGVMPMDSAFKRRWNFRYVRITIDGAVHELANITYAAQTVTWGNLVRAINEKLKNLGLEEDRLIGPYFIKPDEIGRRSATDKLLLYLWDDVLRHNRDRFFSNQISTFTDLSDQFEAADVFDLLSGVYRDVLLAGQNNTENAIDEDDQV